jgi:maleate isomerase
MMRPAGVTNHYSRIFTPNAQAISNESFMAGINVIGDNVLDAVRSVMTCSPDYLVMGMSSISFNGGAFNAEVRRYFAESGFEVVRDICLQCRSWTGIAEVPPEILRDKLIELNSDGRDTDALIQVGTNLSMVRLAAAAEMWLGKPVVAINTATYWHALRQNNIKDKIAGLGRLLEEL